MIMRWLSFNKHKFTVKPVEVHDVITAAIVHITELAEKYLRNETDDVSFSTDHYSSRARCIVRADVGNKKIEITSNLEDGIQVSFLTRLLTAV